MAYQHFVDLLELLNNTEESQLDSTLGNLFSEYLNETNSLDIQYNLFDILIAENFNPITSTYAKLNFSICCYSGVYSAKRNVEDLPKRLQEVYTIFKNYISSIEDKEEQDLMYSMRP